MNRFIFLYALQKKSEVSSKDHVYMKNNGAEIDSRGTPVLIGSYSDVLSLCNIH